MASLHDERADYKLPIILNPHNDKLDLESSFLGSLTYSCFVKYGLANSDLPKRSETSVSNDFVVSANSEIGRPSLSSLFRNRRLIAYFYASEHV